MPATPARKDPHETTASAARTAVTAIMTRNVTTVRSGTSVETVTEMLLARGLSRVPVVDDGGRVIGMVSKTDLVKRAHDSADTSESPAPDARLLDLHGFHVHVEGAAVEEVMSSPVTAVGETASIQRAAQLMVGSQMHGLPVVTASGMLVGFVSAMDVLAWLSGLR